MIRLSVRWTLLLLASPTTPGSSLDTVLVPVLFDVFAFALFILGVAAFLWGRSKRGNTFLKERGTGTGSRRGITVLTGVTAILPIAWLFLVWTSVSTASGTPPAHPQGTPTQQVASPTPTPVLAAPGLLTIGASTNVLSQTSLGNNKREGFDVELANGIAKNMGLKAQFESSTDEISSKVLIQNLQNKKYDIVVSALKMTEDLEKQVDFVPYLNVGESLLVALDNPKTPPPLLTKNVKELCGPAPGVTLGVRQNSTAADTLKDDLTKCKQGTIFQIKTEPSTSTAVQALLNHEVDAVFEDSTITDYYISKMNQDGKLARGGQVINSVQEGIAVRKGDKLMLQAVQKAFDQFKSEGSYSALIYKSGFIENESLLHQ